MHSDCVCVSRARLPWVRPARDLKQEWCQVCECASGCARCASSLALGDEQKIEFRPGDTRTLSLNSKCAGRLPRPYARDIITVSMTGTPRPLLCYDQPSWCDYSLQGVGTDSVGFGDCDQNSGLLGRQSPGHSDRLSSVKLSLTLLPSPHLIQLVTLTCPRCLTSDSWLITLQTGLV